MYRKPPTILIAEDDDGHAFLIEDNLRRAGVAGPFVRFSDGEQVLDFLLNDLAKRTHDHEDTYVLLLDIRMPKLDGVEVLRRVKSDPVLHKLPTIILTTTDAPEEIDRCHELYCNGYVQKPLGWEAFAVTMGKLAEFLSILKVPKFLFGEPAPA